MHENQAEPTAVEEPIEAFVGAVADVNDQLEQLDTARVALQQIDLAASDASRPDLAGLARQLNNLLEVATCSLDAPNDDAHQIIEFVRGQSDLLRQLLLGNDVGEAIQSIIEESNARWGVCLQWSGGNEAGEWGSPVVPTDDVGDIDGIEQEELGLILTSLGPVQEIVQTVPEVAAENDGSPFCGEPQSVQDQSSLVDPNLKLDSEIQEAYRDDAERCLASIESSVLAFEEDPQNPQPLQQVCRELHTLKGASASVGLDRIASFLHQVEDDLQAACDQEGSIDVDPILKCVDIVRQQLNYLGGSESISNNLQPSAAAPSSVERFVEPSGPTQDSVRVKATQLDRLMDMLAELVMLRNRRESRVERLKEINTELVQCVSRLRSYDERCPSAPAQPIERTAVSYTHLRAHET